MFANSYYATVAYGWDAVDATEMTVYEGDLVLVRSVNERGWALAEKTVDNVICSGWVPNDYLTPLTGSSEDQTLIENAIAQLSVAAADSEPAPIPIADDSSSSQHVCVGCNKSIESESSLVAKGRTFHPDCFVCSVCKTGLAGTGFLEKDGNYYCETDYYVSFNPKCAYCNDVILGGYITALDQNYHAEHFLCSSCESPLVGTQYRKKDNKAFCENCFISNYAVKCYKCSNVIDGQVFLALNRNYHKECFSCDYDGHVMNEESFHVHDNKVYCPTHFKKLFSRTCSGCKKEIDGQYLQVLDSYFHSECWNCAKCKVSLASVGCAKKDDGFYCHKCIGSETKATPQPAAPTKAPEPAPKQDPVEQPKPAAVEPTPQQTSVEPKVDPITVPAPIHTKKEILDISNTMAAKADSLENENHKLLPTKDHYTHEELKVNDFLPAHVDRTKKETYLTDEDFKTIFGLDRTAFYALPKWKQNEAKKKVLLF